MDYEWDLPSDNDQQFANLTMAIEIVDFAIEHGGSFHSYGANYQKASQSRDHFMVYHVVQ